MGPEHGFFGQAKAGELCNNAKHPQWKIPIFSLYGTTRKPTPAMMKNIDTIVFDIQDIGARPYTYVSTLRFVLEAASEQRKEVIVADRPVPLPRVTDGPVLEEKFSSFVAMIPAPMSYGMTPGETAFWLKDALDLKLKLRVAEMRGYGREPDRGKDWPPFIPPSPAILSWESATCFPATVFCEAFPSIDCGRRTARPFQLVGAKWTRGKEIAEFLSCLQLPGVKFRPETYKCRSSGRKPVTLDGIRILVTDRNSFRPILTAVSIIHCLQQLYGKDRIWSRTDARPAWFDKLFGTDKVRLALLDGDDGRTIAAHWTKDLAVFDKSRQGSLLYREGRNRR